ncbi:MAG: serine kinase, partial [Cetobacterium sp.]
GDITGRASKLPYFMEIRGLGIIDIKALYGVGAVRISKKLDIIIELQELKSEDYLTAMDYQESRETLLGNEISKIKLYISSGRNAAAMVEIAVMNLMAKRMGYNSEEVYLKELKRKKDKNL